MTTTQELLRTPLHDFHAKRGAKLVDFAGWEMPLHYGSILEEHHQVRRSGGIFDVSHMGRFLIEGKDARRFLDRVCTRQIWGMKDGQARYSIVCNEAGGCLDDVIVYRDGPDKYTMVCNASNRAKLLGHFDAVKAAEGFVYKFEDITLKSAMIAVQGPRVLEVISKHSNEIPNLKRYWFTRKNVLGLDVMIARTGYTGEDGVEVIFRTDSFIAKTALGMLLKDLTAVEDVLAPAGLGARDSLRLEASMALYGHEIDEETDPVSAGLMFAIKIDKSEDPEKSPEEVGRFIGQDALQAIHRDGPARRLVGLELEGRRAARQGMNVVREGTTIGRVTSGCVSPTLEKSIAMAFVDAQHAEIGSSLEVDLGRQMILATVVEMPFYKR